LPRLGVEAAVVETLHPFTYVIDREALNTRPLVIEIVRDVPLDHRSARSISRMAVSPMRSRLPSLPVCDHGATWRSSVN
jgi:hypothetical protein